MQSTLGFPLAFILVAAIGLRVPESEARHNKQDHFSSSYDLRCTEFSRDYAYCWCNTQAGWDYCSLEQNRTHNGIQCRSDHMCGKHAKKYSWCYTDAANNWGYCGRVMPKADPKDHAKVVSHMTSQIYMSCQNECGKGMGKDYFWCYTTQGWDYCSPLPQVTSRSQPCRADLSCGLHGQSYYWCYTTGSNWDYCGQILDAECGYKVADSWKKQSHSSEPQLMCLESMDTKVTQMHFVPESVAAWTNGESFYNEVARELIPYWNSSLPMSFRSEHLTVRKQDTSTIDKASYHTYQIVKQSGQSAPMAEVLVPENKVVPDIYVRRAFLDSLMRKARIRISIATY